MMTGKKSRTRSLTPRKVVAPFCPICGSSRSASLRGPQEEWRYHQCAECRHVWLVPTPNAKDLRKHYNSAYRVPRDAYFLTVERQFPALKRTLEQLTSGRRMLEVGCSYGGMLKRFAAAGWSADGVELDQRAVDVARKELGLHVEAGTLREVAHKLSPPYDVITAYHVIEHVPDPAAFLSQIHEMSAPNGILLLRLPNASSVAANLTKGWWEWFIAPEHINVFSPTSISLLLRKKGFTVISTESRRGDGNRLLFETVKAVGRIGYRAIRKGKRSGRSAEMESSTRRPSSTAAYRTTQALLNVAGAPVDWVIALADRLGVRSMPELQIVARRS